MSNHAISISQARRDFARVAAARATARERQIAMEWRVQCKIVECRGMQCGVV